MKRMDVFFLGAGKSYSGSVPSALTAISKNKKALDWQLQSLARADVEKINFIGGFHVDEIVEQYPQLKYTIAPDWKNSSVIDTLLQSPLRPQTEALFLYSDTLFRPKTIEKISQVEADIVVAIDSHWRTRFENRSDQDLSISEVLNLNDFGQEALSNQVEFTGILKLSIDAITRLKKINASDYSSLLELIGHFYQQGLVVHFFDVEGDWTEFNSELDIAHFVLGTKSETLYRLFPLVKKSIIGEQVTFTVSQWRDNEFELIKKIQQRFAGKPLVVRSSSYAEDCWDESHAGGFESVLNVDSTHAQAVVEAVKTVIDSYQESDSIDDDQILVQECLSNVKMSGVVFTRTLETGAPYYRINFDDQTESTESVTSGTGSQLRTVIVSKEHCHDVAQIGDDLLKLLNGVIEIETLLGYDKLDIEFAIDQKGQLHIFQVRPIAVTHRHDDIKDSEIKQMLDHCVATYKEEQHNGPGVVGSEALFGVMPDWNPAEIIGVKPKPLAYSSYRHLIVDQVWAVQRAEFGYRDVSQYPLIRTFAGQPYVNIRNSFNSFIPASVSEQAAERICDAYIAVLKQKPQLHDKIEFDVAFTVLVPEFISKAQQRFKDCDLSKDDLLELEHGLRSVTMQAFVRLDEDIAGLNQLAENRIEICASHCGDLQKALLLLDDCKKHGTLAFAHAARAGFVAMTFINNLVASDIFSQSDKELFLSSFNTVAGEFEHDAAKVAKGEMSRQDYLNQYGHLRPGTYDIVAKAYWENPEKYLFSKVGSAVEETENIQNFDLSEEKTVAINQWLHDMELKINAEQLLDYCKKATQAREYVKFEFSKNLSKALDLIQVFGQQIGLKRKQMAFLSLADLKEYSLGMLDVTGLKKIIKLRKKNYQMTKMIELPQLIQAEQDFYGFERNASEPNYVTSKSIEAPSVCLGEKAADIKNKIVLIEQADPGYDWMFAHGLAGLITKYGGANSHMAIRSAELNLPAAIGVGDKIYDEFKSASIIRLNCGQKQIIRLK